MKVCGSRCRHAEIMNSCRDPPLLSGRPVVDTEMGGSRTWISTRHVSRATPDAHGIISFATRNIIDFAKNDRALVSSSHQTVHRYSQRQLRNCVRSAT